MNDFKKIMPNRLDMGFLQYKEEFEKKAVEVLRSGWYILGNEVASFEAEFAHYTGARYCVGLANGLDALWIAVHLLGIGAGDEVIVQGNTYIASVMGITINQARPVFVEPDPFFNLDPGRVEERITERTKAIMVVHLYGQASRMDAIVKIAQKHKLRIIEDCAQSHGARYQGKMTGTFGDVGCFSFYPTKNIGAFGDAGCIVTDNETIAEQFRVFRNYGSEKRYYNKIVGTNSRLDELQAGLLRVRLSHHKEILEEKYNLCFRYSQKLNSPHILLPTLSEHATSAWHQYVIRVRDRERLISYLDGKGIGTIIHYPIPPHLAEAYAYLGGNPGMLPITEKYANEVLSIPLYNGMTMEDQDYVIDAINDFE